MPGFKNISGKAGDYSVEKQKNFTETYKKKKKTQFKFILGSISTHFGLSIFDNVYMYIKIIYSTGSLIISLWLKPEMNFEEAYVIMRNSPTVWK